ncbi:MAG: hypothetical protein E5Y67_25380 [Mesorhizobium sp.]|nr:MAG: hypothetical protein E5Y67_25380 [Mesorhizobium sp.]
MALHLSADAVPVAAAPQKYLFGPVADFLMLGGSAFLILPVASRSNPIHRVITLRPPPVLPRLRRWLAK